MYTIHNAPINVRPPPQVGGDLTNLNVNSLYSGADPVIKFLEKMGYDWGFDFYSLPMQSEIINFPVLSSVNAHQLPNRGIVGITLTGA